MTTNPGDRGRIEQALDRPLTDEELEPVESLDALSDEQIAIVASIQPYNRIAPSLFLQAVVPSATFRDILDYIDDIEKVYVDRFPPPELPDQRIFEYYAGRQLLPAERVRAGTVYKMNGTQNVLLQLLAKKDVAVAFLYLSHVAPNDPIEIRHQLAKDVADPSAARDHDSDVRQIEQLIGHALTTEELAVFDRASEVSEVVRAVTVTIARHDRMLAYIYLYERVPRMYEPDVFLFVEQLMQRATAT